MYVGDPTELVYKAIYDALMASNALTTLVGSRIYDHVSDNTPFPYVRIGPIDFKLSGSSTTSGFIAEITISVFTKTSQTEGIREANIIGREIYNILERKGINITDLGMVYCFRTFKNIFREMGEGEVYNGVNRYSLMMGG
jgi:hypothetical protein